MIGRCDRCDAKAIASGFSHFHGVRWDPAQAGMGRWRCPDCGGPLRAKRKGEHESVIVTGRLSRGINLQKTGRPAGDVRRAKKARCRG